MASLAIFASALQGYGWVLLGVGIVIAATGVLPALLCREPYYRTLPAEPPRENLGRALLDAFTNRPFMLLMSIIFLIMAGVSASNSMGVYTIIYYVFQGDKVAGSTLVGQLATVMAVSSFTFIFIIRSVVVRKGKKFGLLVCLIAGAVGNASQWFLIRPDNPNLTFLAFIVIAPSASAFWIVANAMKADVCDWDELRHGQRREGIFAAASNWVQKGASALSGLVSGAGLIAIGFDASLEGAQAPATLLQMRLFISIVPATLFVICLVLLYLYPLNEARMLEINRELESRRGKVA
jgi:GPH family glycoside/pentoside/hexuronide:cation symporter